MYCTLRPQLVSKSFMGPSHNVVKLQILLRCMSECRRSVEQQEPLGGQSPSSSSTCHFRVSLHQTSLALRKTGCTSKKAAKSCSHAPAKKFKFGASETCTNTAGQYIRTIQNQSGAWTTWLPAMLRGVVGDALDRALSHCIADAAIITIVWEFTQEILRRSGSQCQVMRRLLRLAAAVAAIIRWGCHCLGGC